MKARIIKTEGDYEEAVARIDALMDADPDVESDEGKDLELLAMLVEQYEDVHYPMDLPGPVESIKFRMEQAGLRQADLVPYIGSKSKVSEARRISSHGGTEGEEARRRDFLAKPQRRQGAKGR